MRDRGPLRSVLVLVSHGEKPLDVGPRDVCPCPGPVGGECSTRIRHRERAVEVHVDAGGRVLRARGRVGIEVASRPGSRVPVFEQRGDEPGGERVAGPGGVDRLDLVAGVLDRKSVV